MRRNRESAELVSNLANFQGGCALHVGEDDSQAKQLPLGSRHLDTWYDEEIVHRQAILPDEPFIEQVAAGIAGVVVRHRKTAEAFASRGGDQRLRTADSVSREPGVAVEIDVVRHGRM